MKIIKSDNDYLVTFINLGMLHISTGINHVPVEFVEPLLALNLPSVELVEEVKEVVTEDEPLTEDVTIFNQSKTKNKKS